MMKPPLTIPAIRRKYTATDYQWNEETGKEEKVERIISADIEFLLKEVERLMAENARLRGKRNGKVAGAKEGSWY